MDADAALNEYIRRMIVNKDDALDWCLEAASGWKPGMSEDWDVQHLMSCPDIVVTAGEGHDGVYGCDTGCEYLSIEAEVTCPHADDGRSAAFGYSGFNSMDLVFYEMDKIRREAGDAV